MSYKNNPEVYQNPHLVCGMKMSDEEEFEACRAQLEKPSKVDFRLLCELLDEHPSSDIAEVICLLEMNMVPMTDAVRKLGICAGILYA